MSETITVGLDLAKNVFVAGGASLIEVHGADGTDRAILHKKLRRAGVEVLLASGALRCRDGSGWRRSFPGARDRQTGP